MILRNGATLSRSGGYLTCEHKDWIPGVRVGETGHHGAECSQSSHFVLEWVGRISLQRLAMRLCSRHGLEAVRASRGSRGVCVCQVPVLDPPT